MRLRVRFALLLTVPLVLTVVSLGIASYLLMRAGIERVLQSDLEAINLQKESEIVRWIEGSGRNLASVAQRPLIREYAVLLTSPGLSDADRGELLDRLRMDHLLPILEMEGGFLDLSLLHPDSGEILVSTDPSLEGRLRRDREFYTEGRSALFVEDPKVEPDLGIVVMHLSAPIWNSDGSLAGVLAAHADLAEMAEIISFVPGTLPVSTQMMNGYGYFTAAPQGETHEPSIAELPTEGLARALRQEEGTDRYRDHHAVPVLGFYRWSDRLNAAMVSEIPRRIAFQPLYRLWPIFALVGALLVLLAVFVGMRVSRSIVQHLEDVQRGAEEIASGNLTYRTGSLARGEEGDLARSFDKMAERLQELTTSRDALDREVARRMKTEEELRRSEGLFRRVFEFLPVGVWIADKTGTLLSGNPAGIKIWGGSPLVPQADYGVFRARRLPSREEIEPHDWALAHTINEGVTVSDERLEIEAFDGVTRTIVNYTAPVFDEDGELMAAIVVNNDITEQTRMEEARASLEARLQQQQKLESIGTLASGVAHEINNPLMGMINYADLIASRVRDATLQAYARSIIEEGDRVAGIVKALLSFSRQDSEPRAPMDVNEMVRGALTLVGSVLRKDQIAIDLDLAENLPTVECRGEQLRQVLVNLLTNARDALNERFPGYDDQKRVLLRSESIQRDGLPWVRVMVCDSGAGIPETVRNRVFDPFFTTKPRDMGTGLGLAVSYGIIREHGGDLALESEVGRGTELRVELPCSRDVGREAS